jgi:hypothetical protein
MPTLGTLGSIMSSTYETNCTPEALSIRTAAATVSRKIMKPPSLIDWYFMLRTHHQWTMFQAIRYALWLAR